MSDIDPVLSTKRYGTHKYVVVENIYPAHHGGLYLYDPDGELPYEVSKEGSGDDLTLTWEEARKIRDQLNEILGKS